MRKFILHIVLSAAISLTTLQVEAQTMGNYTPLSIPNVGGNSSHSPSPYLCANQKELGVFNFISIDYE
jgi:hypothetical protein